MKKDIKPFCVEILLCFLILNKRWYSNIHNLKYAYLEDVFDIFKVFAFKFFSIIENDELHIDKFRKKV